MKLLICVLTLAVALSALAAGVLAARVVGSQSTSGFDVPPRDSPLRITIKRVSRNSASITGELHINGKLAGHTLELPWNNNAVNASAIPEGIYSGSIGFDRRGIWHIKLGEVPGRTHIQIHRGSLPSQIKGCILIADKVHNTENRLSGTFEAHTRIGGALKIDRARRADGYPALEISVEADYVHWRGLSHPRLAGTQFRYSGSGEWRAVDALGEETGEVVFEQSRDDSAISFPDIDGEWQVPLREHRQAEVLTD